MSQFETLEKSTIEIPSNSEFTIEEVAQTKGYDGHSLRAFGYFGDQMPDIVDTVESINSIKDKYDHLRSDSKAPTFALRN